jgi:tRNA pseudouridine55 synthase
VNPAVRATAYRDISGILLLDKPPGMSSNQALQSARRLYGARKGGHTGSLDPLATGLLPICFGEATKIAGHLLGARKAYDAQGRLGITTTTDDAQGETLESLPVPAMDDGAIQALLPGLHGRIVQTPPAYSAIKQGGVPLYKRARRGEDVQAPPREVVVHRLELRQRQGDVLWLHVECGSGTYVRSLVRDLGRSLGCGAHLTALRRTWVDPFVQPVMSTLEQLEEARATGGYPALDALLVPLEQGLALLPAVPLDAAQAQCLRHGQRLNLADFAPLPLGRALDGDGRLVALVEIAPDGDTRVRRGFNAPKVQS